MEEEEEGTLSVKNIERGSVPADNDDDDDDDDDDDEEKDEDEDEDEDEEEEEGTERGYSGEAILRSTFKLLNVRGSLFGVTSWVTSEPSPKRELAFTTSSTYKGHAIKSFFQNKLSKRQASA